MGVHGYLSGHLVPEGEMRLNLLIRGIGEKGAFDLDLDLDLDFSRSLTLTLVGRSFKRSRS